MKKITKSKTLPVSNEVVNSGDNQFITKLTKLLSTTNEVNDEVKLSNESNEISQDSTLKNVDTIDKLINDELSDNEIIDVKIEEIQGDNEVESVIHNMESEFVIENEQPTDPTEVQMLLDQELDDLLEEKQQLEQRLLLINQRLPELGYQIEQPVQSKSEQCRNWIKLNPKCTRADFMSQFRDLGSKALLSTYYQKFKFK